MTAGRLVLGGVERSFGATPVLRGIDLTVEAGTALALLGPSGCGKTTLLRLIAGFDALEAGSIALDGRMLTGARVFVPPHRRGIGFVPQDGALFPHLSVAGNIGFGLGRAGRAARVLELLDVIGLTGFGERMPHQLSGGQQQRVALARALAPRPGLILLDEPFNALDSSLRRSLCPDVRRILKASGSTAILVTHDRDEAFAFADRLAIMRDGRIVQSGTPRAVYDEPQDLDAAALVGATVCLAGRRRGEAVDTALGPLAIGNPRASGDGRVIAMLRPEQIVPVARGEGALVTIREQTFLGPLVWVDLVAFDAGRPVEIRACWPARPARETGSETGVRVEGAAWIFADLIA